MIDSGTKLGPYEIQSPLGEGGMGEVYRARDTRLERTVAIKVLNSQLVATPGLVPIAFYNTSFDATPDGKHFLLNTTGERPDQSRAVLITNWPAKLKK